MSSRATPFQSKPSSDWLRAYEALCETKLFLIARLGPTVFKVRDESNETFKVTLANPIVCTCSSAATTCVHVLYCMIKVLRVSKTHTYCFQTSLMDAELDSILSGQCCERIPKREIRPFLKRSSSLAEANSSTADDSNGGAEEQQFAAKRRPLSEEDDPTCPICYETMTDQEALTWCRDGCGKNLHAKCMSIYAQHQRGPVLCPLCRSAWNMDLLQTDLLALKSQPKKFSKCDAVVCTFCKCLQRRLFHRCIECSQKNFAISAKPVDFCGDCFSRRLHEIHRTHHFLTSDASIENAHEVTWSTAKNPIAQAVETNTLLELQTRELSVEDYELLRNLDRKDAGDFPVLLVSSLPLLTKETIHANPTRYGTCFCSKEVDSLPHCLLPCHHVAHRKCIQRDVETIIQEDDISKVCLYRCSHPGCGGFVFGGLRRKMARPKKATDVQDDANSKKSTDMTNSLGLSSIGALRSQAMPAAVGVSGLLGIAGRGLNESQQGGEMPQPTRSSIVQRQRPPRVRSTEAQNTGDIAIINRPIPSIPHQHRLHGRNHNDDSTFPRFSEGASLAPNFPSSSAAQQSPAVHAVGNLLQQSVQEEMAALNVGGTSFTSSNKSSGSGQAFPLPSVVPRSSLKRAPPGRLRSLTANAVLGNTASLSGDSDLDVYAQGLGPGRPVSHDTTFAVASLALPKPRRSVGVLSSSRSADQEPREDLSNMVLEVGSRGTALSAMPTRAHSVSATDAARERRRSNRTKRESSQEPISGGDLDSMLRVNHYES